MSMNNKLEELILKDQNNIKSFRQGVISKDSFLLISREISTAFLNFLGVHGFPYKDISLNDIYKAGITLGLHLDLKNMKAVFSKYVEKVPPDKIEAEHRAMFIDKILILSGKPQIYGTQFKISNDKMVELLPVQDMKDLDKIRQKAGLKQLNEYLNLIS